MSKLNKGYNATGVFCDKNFINALLECLDDNLTTDIINGDDTTIFFIFNNTNYRINAYTPESFETGETQCTFDFIKFLAYPDLIAEDCFDFCVGHIYVKCEDFKNG